MKEFLPEIEHFIRNFVLDKKQWQLETSLKDKLRKSERSVDPGSYYN